ncbi:hypothetical protein I548_5309 [Mycobacterium intracellulare]|nr:hypothetical protein I548_5309 [Mycobacterium intracellulare]
MTAAARAGRSPSASAARAEDADRSVEAIRGSPGGRIMHEWN